MPTGNDVSKRDVACVALGAGVGIGLGLVYTYLSTPALDAPTPDSATTTTATTDTTATTTTAATTEGSKKANKKKKKKKGKGPASTPTTDSQSDDANTTTSSVGDENEGETDVVSTTAVFGAVDSEWLWARKRLPAPPSTQSSALSRAAIAKAVAQDSRCRVPGPDGITYLLIAFDLETTGLNTMYDHITQIAGVCHAWPDYPFATYVKTSRKIPKEVTDITGITSQTLQNAPFFGAACVKFLGWITTIVGREYERAYEVGESVKLVPVLVAHNGDSFDVPLFVREMCRHGVPVESLLALDLRFTDTLALVRAARKGELGEDVASMFTECSKSNLTALHTHFVGEPFDNAHNALGDVIALNRLMFESKLGTQFVLQTLCCVAFSKRVCDHFLTLGKRELSHTIGPKKGKNPSPGVVSASVVKKLGEAGLTVDVLSTTYTTEGAERFVEAVGSAGVSSEDDVNALTNYFAESTSS